VDFSYIWGDALEELRRAAPDLRIVNLETSVTISEDWVSGKGIHYRMNPANVPFLTAAGIDCCVLANNHVLDWGRSGLAQTLETLRKAGVKTAGAGPNLASALEPAMIEIPGKGRVLVFAFGTTSSGIPEEWAATDERGGVALLGDLGEQTVSQIARRVAALKRPGDVVVASIHWGDNWGYEVPRDHRDFAHNLIDQASVDILHGHSSHHPKGIEVYKGKPILYGCGDFLNDYEGIGGYEKFRSHLALMYLLTIDSASRNLLRFEMKPFEIKRFRLQRAATQDAEWLQGVLDRESRALGAQVSLGADNTLALGW
jgi:poly-gamma-glutamate synthesis protein (capsule biosynthesis protein)